ncbi:MAG: 4Fe-4S binding protein [Cyanobacteria bacterium J06592_8]
MFHQIPERQMHLIRWLLTLSWLLLILSLFYDPISPQLTSPDHPWSPFRLNLDACIQVQGVCLEQKPYPLGTTIFWCFVLPSVIFLLLVFGHELWRRICPLAFISQIPRALGIQRKHQKINSRTGKIHEVVVTVRQNSWLARNHSYLQFGLLYIGLCGRLLFFNADRWALGFVCLMIILSAIIVGYLYDGKSWCQYFCPMLPVQQIFGEPRGLLTSEAHTSVQPITQSMCRVSSGNEEKKACVGCKPLCIDIDAEKSYWVGINQPKRKFIYYGYVGLVIGYFLYYYLYAGNWDYYLSGIWVHESDQMATVMKPGFYLLGNPSPIPKLVAVPLILGLFTWGGYFCGRILEKVYQAYQLKRNPQLSLKRIQNQIFALCTFLAFNFFFLFGSRPVLKMLSTFGIYFLEELIILVSALWLGRTWQRSLKVYLSEKQES